MAATLITLNRTYDLASSNTPRGKVVFRPTHRFENETTVVEAPVVAYLNSSGAMSIQLYANTDTGTTPSGTGYHVREELIGDWAGINADDSLNRPTINEYVIVIPHDEGATLSLADLEPVGDPPTINHVSVREGPLSLKDPRVGCLLDGAGDEAAKVATAISLLPATGGHIYHPPGTLRTSAIQFDRPVRWEGAGDQASIVKAANGFTETVMTVTADAPFSHIEHVRVDGGGSAGWLIHIASARVRVTDVHLQAAGAVANGAALYFHGVSSEASAHASQISNVRIIDCGQYGAYLRGFSYDNEFSNLWIGPCAVGIRVENTNGFFSNTHVWGCSGNGVELRDGNHVFTNCYMETNGGSGFNLFNAPRVKISNSNIWKNTGAGIVGSGTSHRLSVVGCNIYDNGTNGVQGADMLHGKVIGNDFYDDTSSSNSQDRPVLTTGTSDKWIIVGNTFLTSEHATGANSLVGSNNVVDNNVTT